MSLSFNYEKFIDEQAILQKFPFLNREEAYSLMLYKGSYYEVINHYLRTGIFRKTDKIQDESTLNKIIVDIKKAMRPIGKRTTVYRGMPYRIENITKSGAQIFDLAFMSTSSAEEKTYEFTKDNKCCVFYIHLTPDIQCIQFDDSEREILLENGLKLADFIYKGILDTEEDGPKYIFECKAYKTTAKERESILNESRAQELVRMKNQALYRERMRKMLEDDDFLDFND